MENNEKLTMMKILAEGLFGSWEKFLAAMDGVNNMPCAKVNFMEALNDVRPQVIYADKKYRLISIARDIIDELGYIPTGLQLEEEFRKRGEYGSRATFSRMFGGSRNFISLVLSSEK